MDLQQVYDQNRKMIEDVENNPNVPQHVKIYLRNMASYASLSMGLLLQTHESNKKNQLSPIAGMEPVLNIDLRGQMDKKI